MTTQSKTQAEAHSRQLIRNSLIIGGAVLGLALALLTLAGVLALAVLGADFFFWASVTILAGAALVFAVVLVDAWTGSRWMLVQTIAANVSRAEAEANAVRERAHAESERILAEADALDRASLGEIQQLNLNSGSGNQKVTNKPITYTVRGQVVNGNQLNQISAANEPRRIEIGAADVRWFVEQLPNYGHSKAKWVNKVELPYSRLPVTYEIYASLINAIAQAGGIVGRGERASGKLVETDPAQLVKLIEQTHPGAGSRGIVLELPAVTSGN